MPFGAEIDAGRWLHAKCLQAWIKRREEAGLPMPWNRVFVAPAAN
jgi:hypothetical protein